MIDEQESKVVTDGELLTEFVHRGNQSAFEEVVRRHGHMVWRVCRQLARDRHDAEDAAQLVFSTLAQRAPSLIMRASVGGWLHRTAWHVTMRYRRANEVRRRHEDLAAATVCVQESAIHEQIDREVLVVEVARAMARLPEPSREILVLHYMEGLTVQEAARQAGVPFGTAASRLHRGKDLLRMWLEERGLVFGTGAFGVILAATLVEEEKPAVAAYAIPFRPTESHWAGWLAGAQLQTITMSSPPAYYPVRLSATPASPVRAAGSYSPVTAGYTAARIAGVAPMWSLKYIAAVVVLGGTTLAVAAPVVNYIMTPPKGGFPVPSRAEEEAAERRAASESSASETNSNSVPEPTGLLPTALIIARLLSRSHRRTNLSVDNPGTLSQD